MADAATTTVLDAGDSTARKPHPALALLGMTCGLGVILVLMLLVFIMPSLKSGPHDLQVGIVGTSAAADRFETSLATAAPDAYTSQRFASEQELRDAIHDRDVIGGFVVAESGVRTLVAGAGSTAISGSLAGTAQAVGGAIGTDVTVEDVVPLPESDPTGVGIGGLAFPLVFGGIVPVVAFRKILPRSDGWYLTGLLVFAAVGGIVVASILTFAFGKHRIDLRAGRGIHGPRYRRPCTSAGRTPEGLRCQGVHHRCDGHDVPRQSAGRYRDDVGMVAVRTRHLRSDPSPGCCRNPRALGRILRRRRRTRGTPDPRHVDRRGSAALRGRYATCGG